MLFTFFDMHLIASLSFPYILSLPWIGTLVLETVRSYAVSALPSYSAAVLSSCSRACPFSESAVISSVVACLESKISIVSLYRKGLLVVFFSYTLRLDPFMSRPNIFSVIFASAVIVFAFWYALVRWRVFFLPRFFVPRFGGAIH